MQMHVIGVEKVSKNLDRKIVICDARSVSELGEMR